MRTPPPAGDAVLVGVTRRPDRDLRFLVFLGLVLATLALAFKSGPLALAPVVGLGAGLLLLGGLGVLGYLTIGARLPAPEHLVPTALGILVVAGLAPLMSRWWSYALVAGAFGSGVAFACRLDYRHLRDQARPFHLVVQEAVLVLVLAGSFLVVVTETAGPPVDLKVRLAGAFTISLAATYRSFRVLGRPMSPRRALLFSVFVAQLVAFFAWAMTISTPFGAGLFAVMLLLLWYVNRGIIRHTVEETLSRNVIVEYGLFVVLIAYLYIVAEHSAP